MCFCVQKFTEQEMEAEWRMNKVLDLKPWRDYSHSSVTSPVISDEVHEKEDDQNTGSPARSPNQLITGLEEPSGLLAPGLVAWLKQTHTVDWCRKWKMGDLSVSSSLEKERRQEQENPESSGEETDWFETSRKSWQEWKQLHMDCKYNTIHSHPSCALEGVLFSGENL